MNLQEQTQCYDVAIVPCDSYQPQPVQAALEQAITAATGWDWLQPGSKVAIKTNLVAPMKKEQAATTHPAVLAALTRLLLQRGAAQVVVGDSPGGLFTEAALNHAYQVTGLAEVQQAGAVLNRNFATADICYPEAKIAKFFTCTAWLQEADVIIDACKLKSHGMMGLSAAAKNMFGVIPGTQKPEYHFRFPNAADFADMILDLDTYFHPALCIGDGIVGMEGNGPTQGKPRAIGVVMASVSPHKLDLAAAELLGMQPDTVPTLVAARGRGWIPETAQQLRIYGSIAQNRVPDFEKLDVHNDITFGNMAGGGLVGKAFSKLAARALNSKPLPRKKECIGCGKCAGICPANAITLKNRLPEIDREKCIRCFCCQEFCPVGAMKVHRTAIAKLLTGQK